MEKSKIYILGLSSFIAKHFYLSCKKINNNIILLQYNQLEHLKKIASNDIVINFCGVNRAETVYDYNIPDYIKLVEYPYLFYLFFLLFHKSLILLIL